MVFVTAAHVPGDSADCRGVEVASCPVGHGAWAQNAVFTVIWFFVSVFVANWLGEC